MYCKVTLFKHERKFLQRSFRRALLRTRSGGVGGKGGGVGERVETSRDLVINTPCVSCDFV